MKELENNAYFWQKLDSIYLSGDFKTIYKKGQRHPKYEDLVFPCDYGHVESLFGESQETLRVLKGDGSKINAIVLRADMIEKAVEVIAVVGLEDEQTLYKLLEVLNDDTQKTILIRRGKDVPDWAISE